MSEIQARSVAESLVADACVDYDALLPQRAWDELERALAALRDAPHDRNGQRDYYGAYREFADYSHRHGSEALAALRHWRADRPDSEFPALLEAAYWTSWFERYRSTSTVDQVTAAMWTAARTAQDALLCTVVRMLERGGNGWPALASTIYTVAALGEPDWWTRWLLAGERPASLPTHGASAEIDELLAPSGAAEAVREYAPALPAQLPAVLTGEALAWRRAQNEDGPAPQQYWLRAAFALDPSALEAAVAYVCLRMPRWGGSWEEMLAFADSPLCDRFDEEERNVLRFFAWFDELEVDDSAWLEDPRVLRHHLRLGQQLLERPLPQNLRGRVHKYLAYLEALNGRIDAACAHYPHSAPHNHYQEWEIVRAVWTWAASEDRGPWLGRIAETNRLVSAHGAALYGLLSLNGWAGMQRRPEVADAWFERAVAATPDPSSVPSSPFNALSDLAELYGSAALRPMWLKAAELGDASAQFRCGALFADEDNDMARAIEYYRLAADNRHEVAMYNVASLSLIPVRDGEVAGAQAEAVARDALDYLDRALARTEHLFAQDPTEFNQEQLERVKDLYGTVLFSDWAPLSARQRALPQVLAFARQGRFNSMVSLGWWYGDKDLAAFDFEEAVYWIEAARHLEPDSEYVHKLRAYVEVDTFFGRMKFASAQSKAKRRGFPGQDDAGL
ncbi:DUF4034 domain-containing protein [Lysobacter enzymogenes]|uniref:DUF4034 domain-containing protein n=1 Tax=Lysobacter enzymogenes TaxID=69 RepID=A0AAU9AI63_LYSEN|nr:DUF4034 domain-containing protein [Lysobacter enzymogenes]BAV98820.1 hypothetical protein LEN_3333 [Lysobacter enzymogenes]